MIRFENLSKTFASGDRLVDAVKNVNLTVEKGKVYGIIGFSGAGKSTLVRCINLLEKPTEGKVYIGDVELTALKGKELRKQRRKIGMIFQHFNLFASRTVFENVAYSLKHQGLSKKQIEEKVNELLKLVGLEEKAKEYPSKLSGGQKQRVAIARALANDPDILLSDESTSALDPQTTVSILKLLREVNQKLGITIVIITHEMQVVKEICDRVAVMENGEVVEEGGVFEIFANPQKKITKDFVDSTSNLSRIYHYIDEKAKITELRQGECILRFKYLERSTSEALVSQLSREFALNINIIFGNIELIGENPIGGLVSIVSGKKEDIDSAIKYLQEKNVGVEVILDARAS
ncbi:MAG TPA: methionine ABC transporter ATP-binding protein [Lachnoclostridium phytofermentans]|uniref:Methionine ABC transporter ATP-binding protein n=1 Tax=Lachnoclostridium phytofermentans TaxID=66219 RepID=A0A3D2X1Y4_9FIRM|nr:methionine ABC transporter ATP-binding protein [Lachnoclostridium sp.]HCL00904.1 methionine ABC transporter ATP-binding protein [Lachnoclostridium phytofermentans]